MTRFATLAIALLLAGVPHAHAAEPPADAPAARAWTPGEWQHYVEAKRSAIGVPALAVGAANHERILFADVAGVDEVGGHSRAEAGERFHIGSVTKPVTATLVARLVEAGTMQWETTPADVWPDEAGAFPPALRRITVEQLLAHRAGMPAFESDEENATFEPRDDESPREERARFARWLLVREPAFPIGDHVYSNAGYGLVAAMAEQLTGFGWEELTRREVFVPLGMDGCGFGWPAGMPGQPRGHRMVGGTLEVHDMSDGYRLRASIAPAGDIHCPMDDLLRFGQAHLRGLHAETGFLRQATFEKLHDAPHGEYALGWNIRPFGSHHLGSAGTFVASLIIFPDDRLVTAVATNASGVMTDEQISGVMSEVYRRLRDPRPSTGQVQGEVDAER